MFNQPGPEMTDNTLQLLATAANSEETRANLEQLSKATQANRDAADDVRRLRQEHENAKAQAEAHLICTSHRHREWCSKDGANIRPVGDSSVQQ